MIWDSFIETCESEEYSACTVVVDGEKFGNIAIRAKGNTSLSSVKALNSQRYSFKLEFDQYEKGKSYYGLDKLCLNNIIQDNTMMKDFDAENGNMPQRPNDKSNSGDKSPKDNTNSDSGNTPQMPGGGFGEFGGMGSDDVKLKYIDDDADSYSNIFDNAKTDISKSDRKRLIASLKNLSEYTDLEHTLDMEEVLRYFVVHNFVVNGDSYNSSIDEPVSGGSVDDRPMVGWIFSKEEYTQQYHELFSEFIEKWIDGGKLSQFIDETAEMIQPYVEKDPTKFCTTEEFESGVSAISQFVSLRGEAVGRQLSGDTTTVDTNGLDTSVMGSMGDTMKGGFGGRNEQPETKPSSDTNKDVAISGNNSNSDGTRNENESTSNFPGGNFPRGDFSPNGNSPQRSNFPEGDFSRGNFPQCEVLYLLFLPLFAPIFRIHRPDMPLQLHKMAHNKHCSYNYR